jgi:hypothetical protein
MSKPFLTQIACDYSAAHGDLDGITAYVKAKYQDKNFCIGGTGLLSGAEPEPA